MAAGYAFSGPSITLGAAMHAGKAVPQTPVRAPLKTFNRHGLIAGATGTGKTKTLQRLAEALSAAGVPVLAMDIKGDLSGIGVPGTPAPRIEDRHSLIGEPWRAEGFPVEFLSLTGEQGLPLRATVSEFGPILFSRILQLNETQEGVVALMFKYCDDRGLPLLDLKDVRRVLQHLTGAGKKELAAEYGTISTQTAGTILRKIVELEGEGADVFFGEPSFDVNDLLRTAPDGRGVVSILRLMDMQNRPKLFSTFMLCLLAEIFEKFPEQGDLPKPRLVLFIDEAHLVFKEATRALQDHLETVIKLIRSKGVGVYFCTQSPAEIPAPVLGQLGMKVQHALRAFTAQDRKAIRLAAENYPETEFYDTDELLTALGIGEALVTLLDERGVPTPLVHTLLCTPHSRMDVLTGGELKAALEASPLAPRYRAEIDRESAYELLAEKMQDAPEAASGRPQSGRQEKSTLEKVLDDPLTRQVGRTVAREVTRGILGVLGIGSRRRSR